MNTWFPRLLYLVLMLIGYRVFRYGFRHVCRGIENRIPSGRFRRLMTYPIGADRVTYSGWPISIPHVRPSWVKVGLLALMMAMIFGLCELASRG